MTWSDLIPHIRHLSAEEQDIIRKAFDMGKVAHEGQTRKSGEPYFSHPIAVAGILGDMGADAETITAALLHDTIEDTTITDADIKKAFGPTVLAMVDGVTKLNKEHIANQPTLDAKIETLRKMFTLMQKDVRIMVIKLADRLHNMQTAEFLSEEKQKKLARETLDIYVKIAEQLSMHAFKNILEERIFSVQDAENMKLLQKIKKKHDKLTDSIIHTLHHDLEHHFKNLIRSIKIRGEIKDWSEIAAYQSTDENTPNHLTISIIFICQTIDECYRTMGALHQLWRRETLSFHDLINAPLLNGYKGLHTTIILPTGERIHCKIRTTEMDTYAEKGITTLCFDGKKLGVQEYLPWTRFINPLTEDTKKRSDEFWESLKSDILGETITIHGPDDGTAMIPSNATALDAIFYLFGDLAPRVQKISVNGIQVSFDHPLKYADTISVEVSSMQQLTHDWLKFVHTGFALSRIRYSLRQEPYKQKIHFARSLLQEYILEQHGGYLNEYDDKKMEPLVQQLGYQSFNDALIAIADGEAEVEDIYTNLFEHHKKITQKEKQYSVKGIFTLEKKGGFQPINEIEKKFNWNAFHTKFIQNTRHAQTMFHGKISLKETEKRYLLQILHNYKIRDISIETIRTKRWNVVIVLLLILLWGMDPIVAQKLLTMNIPPISLTFFRFLSLFLASSVSHILHQTFSKRELKTLSPIQPSLILSGIFFFLTAILTYESLQHLTASQYILFTLGGQLIGTSIFAALRRSFPIHMYIAILFIALSIILTTHIHSIDPIGIILGCAAAISFTFYSHTSEFFQKETVQIRYPAYLFWVSTIGLLLSIITAFYTSLSLPSLSIINLTLFSIIIFTFLPYVLFFEMMRKIGRSHLEIFLPFICVATFISEIIIQKIPFITFAPIIGIIAIALFFIETPWLKHQGL